MTRRRADSRVAIVPLPASPVRVGAGLLVGGNQGLPLALAETLDVRLSTPAERVAWGHGGVRVAVAGGSPP